DLHPSIPSRPPTATPQLHADAQDTHSVPTRRSSDLGEEEYEEKIVELMEAVDEYVPTPERDTDKPFMMPVEDVFSITGIMNGLRSEEHTSELQSRFDLVCRLLLGKKKRESGRPARTR